jgi:hypothetical protein
MFFKKKKNVDLATAREPQQLEILQRPGCRNDENTSHAIVPLIIVFFQVIAVVSIVFIIISTIVLTLNTLPYFEVGYGTSVHYH